MKPTRIRCHECDVDLLDPDTPLVGLDPLMVADLCRAHDYAEHGRFRAGATYDAVATAIAMIQAQHEGTPQ